MQSCWEAIHEANRRSLSQQAIATGLGISRSTVARYVRLDKPPVHGEGSLEKEAEEKRLTESLVSLPWRIPSTSTRGHSLLNREHSRRFVHCTRFVYNVSIVHILLELPKHMH